MEEVGVTQYNLRSKSKKIPDKKRQKKEDSFDPKLFKSKSEHFKFRTNVKRKRIQRESSSEYESESESESERESSSDENDEKESSSLDEDSNEELKDFIDDDFIPEKDVSSTGIEQIIENRIAQKFPELSREEIKRIIKISLEKIKNNPNETESVIESQINTSVELGALGATEGLTPCQIKRLEKNLEKHQKNIKDNQPTIPKILNAPLSTIEKEKCLELYDILKGMNQFCPANYDLKNKISSIIKNSYENDKKINTFGVKLTGELERLNKIIKEDIPTVKKIITSKVSDDQKVKALKIYEIFQGSCPGSFEWFSNQKKIKEILKDTLDRDEEKTEKLLDSLRPNLNLKIKKSILGLETDTNTKSILYGIYQEMIDETTSRSKVCDLKEKLFWYVKLPFQKQIKSTTTKKNLNKKLIDIHDQLDNKIYGMSTVKEKILQAINDKFYNTQNSSNIIALKGKPGVGKTKMARIIAQVLELPFEKISLGGAIDSTIFRGSDNVWSGASPSLLLQLISRAGCSNPVILLDEIDKLSDTHKGFEVQNSLLHILDKTQNTQFQDSFLCEVFHDISNILFIASLNDDSKIDPTLKDRLNIIDIPPYTRKDIYEIVKKFTLPEALEEKGLKIEDVTITDEAINCLLVILNIEQDSGMRTIEKEVSDIISKINLLKTLSKKDRVILHFKLSDFKGFPYIITPSTIKKLYKNKKSSSQIPSYFT